MSVFDRRPVPARRSTPPPNPNELPASANPLAHLGMLLTEAMYPQSRDHALDVACSVGHVAFTLSMFIKSGRVVGVDSSPALLAEARRRKEAGGFSGVELYAMPSERLGFSTASFNLATCNMAIGDTAQPEAVLAEMGRVLRPGGWIGVTLAHPGAAVLDALPAAGDEPNASTAVGPAAAPLPTLRSLWDERAVAEKLMEAGFTATHVQVVRRVLLFRTVEEWWRAGAPTPNRPLPQLAPGAAPDPLPAELARRMREQLLGAPLRVPVAVTLGIARKR